MEKITALFDFIEFLHSNINDFKSKNDLIENVYSLSRERGQLRPSLNYKDRLSVNKLKSEVSINATIIDNEILLPIIQKANELNICDVTALETLWNYNIGAIENFKRNFNEADIPLVMEAKRKYTKFIDAAKIVEYTAFFNDLNEILDLLFDYFSDDVYAKVKTLTTWATKSDMERIFEELLSLQWIDASNKPYFMQAFGMGNNSIPYQKFNIGDSANKLQTVLILMVDRKMKTVSKINKAVANNLFITQLTKTNITKDEFNPWSEKLPMLNKLRRLTVKTPKNAGELNY